MIALLLFGLVLAGIYFLHVNYQYWEKRGVPGPKPRWLTGNMSENYFLKKSLSDVYTDFYRQFKNDRIVGIFRTGTPSLMVRDPELIKDVVLKSFQHFQDNDIHIKKEVDPLMGRNPFFSKGEEWKKVRNHLTPGFTSGKMKRVYPLLEEVSKNFAEYIGRHPTATSGRGCSSKELAVRFTLNNIGNVVFGLDAKCFVEEDPEFKQIADGLVSPVGWQAFKIFLGRLIPAVNKFISIKFTPNHVEKKLFQLVAETLKYREENKIVRNDYLDIFQHFPTFTIVDITAHVAGFFLDGYETSSIVMQFIFYELAANLEKQTELRKEIRKVFQENNSIPYDQLQKMAYLDACIKESLRLHPPLGVLSRVCTKPYTYVPTENEVIKRPFVIEPETVVVIPVFALHQDPQYYKDPTMFKPERFLSDNEDNISKYTFLPFGEGPRACIGRRFGELQVKLATAYVVLNYQVTVNKKTQLPLKHDPMYFLTSPKGDIWLDFEKIADV